MRKRGKHGKQRISWILLNLFGTHRLQSLLWSRLNLVSIVKSQCKDRRIIALQVAQQDQRFFFDN